MHRALMACVLISIGGCAAQPAGPPVVAGPVNSERWVGTQYPAGRQDSSSPQLPFQTSNSLPRGAVNTPGR